jgi:putative protease
LAQSDLKKRCELLSPAGSPESLCAAVNEGADAVYLGLKTFNARLRSGNFAYSQFQAAAKVLRGMGRKLYVAVNTVWTERETDRIYQHLKYISDIGCDGVIVHDFGTLSFIQNYFNNLKIHASTQMNIASANACNLLSKQKVSRVVLSRELSMEEIRQIRAQTNIEIEVFVHGALCVSASGLCLFSSYLGGKSANRGLCTQACRRLYSVENSEDNKYYFSMLDLQLIEKIPDLVRAGVDAFKIEGRMKSAEYTGNVTAAYRAVLDAVLNSEFPGDDSQEVINAVKKAVSLLENDFARAKTLFHFEKNNPNIFLNPDSDGGTGIRLGCIARIKNRASHKLAFIENSPVMPTSGDSIRLHKFDDSVRKTRKIKFIEIDDKGSFWVDIPDEFYNGDSVYLIQTKIMSKYYPDILPKNLSVFKKLPGYCKAPVIELCFKNKLQELPEGFYVSVMHIEDLYIAQSIRPNRIILYLNKLNIKQLISRQKQLPFKPHEIILCMDPFFNEIESNYFKSSVHELVGLGYKTYIANNLGHINLYKNFDEGITIIAGTWLYVFNRYAADFLLRTSVSGIVSPLENSRRNLEHTFDIKQRKNVFVTVFAYPSLFRIQSDLTGFYKFKKLRDNHDEYFSLSSGGGNTLVTPQIPFSITDKIPFLQKAGFRRFIVDFSPHPLKKVFYKDIMRAVKNSAPINGASRFNWKNGFYEPKTQ